MGQCITITFGGNEQKFTLFESKYNAFRDAGLEPTEVIWRLSCKDISDNLAFLLDEGIKPLTCACAMQREDVGIRSNLDMLLKAGANPDDMVRRLWPTDIAVNLDVLLYYGARPDNLAARMWFDDVSNNLDILLESGANMQFCVVELDSRGVLQHLDILLNNGVSLDSCIRRMSSDDIAEYYEMLLKRGANSESLDKFLKAPILADR